MSARRARGAGDRGNTPARRLRGPPSRRAATPARLEACRQSEEHARDRDHRFPALLRRFPLGVRHRVRRHDARRVLPAAAERVARRRALGDRERDRRAERPPARRVHGGRRVRGGQPHVRDRPRRRHRQVRLDAGQALAASDRLGREVARPTGCDADPRRPVHPHRPHRREPLGRRDALPPPPLRPGVGGRRRAVGRLLGRHRPDRRPAVRGRAAPGCRGRSRARGRDRPAHRQAARLLPPAAARPLRLTRGARRRRGARERCRRS